jgi:hypothetical protein
MLAEILRMHELAKEKSEETAITITGLQDVHSNKK